MKNSNDIRDGMGMAGSVLANPLTKGGNATVLLPQARGKNDRTRVGTPAAEAFPMRDDRVDWGQIFKPEKPSDPSASRQRNGRLIRHPKHAN